MKQTKKKKKNKVRAIFIASRSKNKKKEYYFIVQAYRGGDFSHQSPEKFDYPAFRKTFRSLKKAREYAYAAVLAMEIRYKNTRFLTRFLEE